MNHARAGLNAYYVAIEAVRYLRDSDGDRVEDVLAEVRRQIYSRHAA